MGIEGKLPNNNIITHGGAKTGADADNHPKIQKVVPKDDRYDHVKQKLLFKNAIEIFKSIPTLEIMENPPKLPSQPNLAQSPTSPPAPRNFSIPRRHSEQSQSVINL
jgi:hypothetical protein